MAFEQGDLINSKYKIIKKIGAGSFGTIYLGKCLARPDHVLFRGESLTHFVVCSRKYKQ